LREKRLRSRFPLSIIVLKGCWTPGPGSEIPKTPSKEFGGRGNEVCKRNASSKRSIWVLKPSVMASWDTIPDAEMVFVVVEKRELWQKCVCEIEELYVLLPVQSLHWAEGIMRVGDDRERRRLKDWRRGWPIVRVVM
jgi:hypothetical protein